MTRVPPHAALVARLKAMLPAAGWQTRFAPAPTGYLHLGHLVNALHVWGIARAYGGQIVLRIEDHDRTRCRPEYEQALREDLEWLGFDADSEAPRQSDSNARYDAALSSLQAAGLVYACDCTRRDIALVAGRERSEELRYPGTCRDRGLSFAQTFARRVQLAPHTEVFDDVRLGVQSQQPSAQCGDVLVRDRHANWTYQFAVTVDDAAQGIDVIIRGEDLAASTGRQQQLARLMGRSQMPLLCHHGLLLRPDGTKLSKANGDTSLRERRQGGATPAQLIGEAAWLAGVQPTTRSLFVQDLAELFR